MNEAQKSVLQRHYKQLSDDIMMTEELLAALYTRKVFERGMIETIKAEKTPTDQVYKMLYMLPKRGPEAFESFVDVIKDDYPWLAAILETSLKWESEMSLSRQASLINMAACTCGSSSLKTEAQVDGCTPRQPLEVNADPDIKSRVGTFIHKQFGQSKRISQQDKKVMEKWLTDQIQTERKVSVKKNSVSSDESIHETQDRSACTSPDPIHADLKRVFNKVKDENLSDLLNSAHASTHFKNENEISGSDEIDSRIQNTTQEDLANLITKLEGETDKLINRMNHMEGLLTQCHYILGDPDRKQKLPTLVKDSQMASKQFEKELNKEKAKTEKMLTELYDYCKDINKLENVRQQQRTTIEKRTVEIEQFKAENAVLREKCTVLEEANHRHMEKEKTLNNLKKMVDDLKSSHTNLADENANYRLNYGTGGLRNYKRPGGRTISRRGSTVVDNSTASTARKPVTKPLYMSNRRTKPLSRFQ